MSTRKKSRTTVHKYGKEKRNENKSTHARRHFTMQSKISQIPKGIYFAEKKHLLSGRQKVFFLVDLIGFEPTTPTMRM